MTFLVERLAELRKHLDHLRVLAPQIPDKTALDRNLSLHNDVLFSLLTVAQLVIDISAELAARKGQRFEDYTEAVRALSIYDEFPEQLVDNLSRLPGFRNVLIHDYVALDYNLVLAALGQLDPVDDFVSIVTRMEQI